MKHVLPLLACISILSACLPAPSSIAASPETPVIITSKPVASSQPAPSSPKLVGNVWQAVPSIAVSPPKWFKNKTAVENYYAPLVAAIRKRNPAADAKYAADKKQKFVLGTTHVLGNSTFIYMEPWLRRMLLAPYKSDLVNKDAIIERCKMDYPLQLQGYVYGAENYCQGAEICEKFQTLVGNYIVEFNKAMVSSCSKP